MPYKRWFAFLIFILSLTLCLAGVIYPPAARRRANLAGCRELGLDPYWNNPNNPTNFTLDSPDGRYLANTNDLRPNRCIAIELYACPLKQKVFIGSCDKGGVIAQEWLSEETLAITSQGIPQIIHVPDLFGHEINDNPDYKPPLANFQAWSPDGNWLVFSGMGTGPNGIDLFRMTPDGSLTENLTRSSTQNYFIGWTAEGDMLFNSYRDGMPELYHLDWETLEFQRLTFSLAQETWLGWEKDHLHALIVTNIFLTRFNIQTTETTPLPITSTNPYYFLGVASDGKYLLIHKREGETIGTLTGDFYWVNLTTNEEQKITMSAQDYFFEVWATDHNAFLVSHLGEANEHIFEIFSLGGTKEEVFRASDLPEFQTWSPDGRWLIFYGYDTVSQQGYFYRVDRQNPHPPQSYPQLVMKNFYWSPDSQWLFYQDDHRLYRIHPESFVPEMVIELPDGFAFQTISPDSQWIYYSVFIQDPLNLEAYRMRLDGSELHPLQR